VATVLFELIWQVDDADGFKRAFLNADATTAAQHLGYHGFVAFYAYGFHAASHHRTEADAGSVAFLDFAFVGV
jgi:hypothetical protein